MLLYYSDRKKLFLADMLDMSGRLPLMSGRDLRPCRTFYPAGFNTHSDH